VNLVVAALITVGVTTLAITAMLLVRRRAPEGSYFTDGDRASGVFGVLAAGFSILLGFIVFLAFSSYDASRSGAESEAVTVVQQVETARLFEPATATRLTGELACYARFVAGPEWDQLEDGTLGNAVNPWGVALFHTLETIDPQTAVEQNAHSKWLDQTSDREQARQDRIHGAIGIIPTPLWIILFVISLIIFVYVLFFADSSEGPVVQAVLMGSVVSVIVLLLLLLQFLDNPFHRGTGSLRPVAMERSIDLIDTERRLVGEDAPLPCDAEGRPNRRSR
jgi:amino acid transporter